MNLGVEDLTESQKEAARARPASRPSELDDRGPTSIFYSVDSASD